MKKGTMYSYVPDSDMAPTVAHFVPLPSPRGGRCACGPCLKGEPRLPTDYWSACTPATSQPLPPLRGLVMFQTSRKGLAPAEASSRIMPENSTLAM